MEEKNKTPWDEFLEIRNQHHQHVIEKINQDLYQDIIMVANSIEETEDNSNFQENIDQLRERIKEENLNQVIDIFIYCQSFLSTNEDQVPMPSQLCIAIGKLFTNKNLHNVASKIYTEDKTASDCALSFLVYLAMYDHHVPYILNFIQENFKGFSANKKTNCVFLLKEMLPDHKAANEIIEKSGITERVIIFGTEIDSTSKPITFKFEEADKKSFQNVEDEVKSVSFKIEDTNKELNDNIHESKSPWWKFW